MKQYLLIFFLVIGAIMSFMLTWRLSTDALAFIAGVLVGAILMTPPILAMLWITKSRVERNVHPSMPQPIYPIVVTGGGTVQSSLPEPFPPNAHPGQGPQTPSLPQPFPAPQREWVMRLYGEE